MRDRFGKEQQGGIGLAALVLSCALIIAAAAQAGDCRPQAQGRQCVASCSLAAAVTECAVATGPNACLCAASPAQQECECFVAPTAAASSAIVAFAGTAAAPERWVGAIFNGYPRLTRGRSRTGSIR